MKRLYFNFFSAGLLALMVLVGACAPPTPNPVPTLMALPTDTLVPPTMRPTLAPTLVAPTESDTLTPTVALSSTTLAIVSTPSSTASMPPSPTPQPSLTYTPTFSDTPAPTQTFTPSLTITDTITPRPSATRTPSPIPTATRDLPALGGLAALAAQVTVLPVSTRYNPPTQTALFNAQATAAAALLSQTQAALQVSIGQPPTLVNGTLVSSIPSTGQLLATIPPPLSLNCTQTTPPSLAALLAANGSTANLLGCPVGLPYSAAAAYQPFERGEMVYLQAAPNGFIYALVSSLVPNRFTRYSDTFVQGVDPESGGALPPPGLLEPVRGFGKVWRGDPALQTSIGYAVAPEAGETATVQLFERGRAVYLPSRAAVYLLVDDVPSTQTGTWVRVAGSF